jgi:hypothetical protein
MLRKGCSMRPHFRKREAKRGSVAKRLEDFAENARRARSRAEQLEDRTEALLADPQSRSYLSGPYLDLLRENLRDLSSAFARSLTLGLLVVAAFELLARAAVGKAALGPFEVNDLSLVEKALPVVGSYIFFDITNTSVRGGEVNGVYRRILESLHPDLAEVGLVILATPYRSSLIPQRLPGVNDSALRRNLSVGINGMLTIALPIWLIYAYSILLRKFGLLDISIWIAVALSLVYVTLGFTTLTFLYQRAD